MSLHNEISSVTNMEYLGRTGFIWFEGIIVDIRDPLQLGRVKVRIFGIHPETSDVLNEDLPWATVLLPTISASVSGIGFSPHGLVNGSQVVGYFRDGKSYQYPVIMGTILGMPQKDPPPDATGLPYHSDAVKTEFSDPEGRFPRNDLKGMPDTNRLARDDHHTTHEAHKNKENNLVTSVHTANSATPSWSEPLGFFATSYPDNLVFETKGGVVAEFDSTEDHQRFFLYHPSGSFYEQQTNGAVVHKQMGDYYEISGGSRNALIGANYNITIQETGTLLVNNDLHIEVKGDRMKIVVERGDCEIHIGGNANVYVAGDVTEEIGGDCKKTIKGNYEVSCGGNYKMIAGGVVDIDGSSILLN